MSSVGSRGLIYPLSTFGITWMVLNASLLFYTAIVTPAVIAFYWWVRLQERLA